MLSDVLKISRRYLLQRILESNSIAFRPSVDADRELLKDSSPETEPKRSKRKRGRRKRRKRRSPSERRSAENNESTSSDSDGERRYRQQRQSSESEDGERQMGDGREDEMKQVRASEAEETERPKPFKPHRKRRRKKGGGSSEESEEDSGKGRQGEHKGRFFEGSKRSLADADGVYLQTDGFRFRWSLVSRLLFSFSSSFNFMGSRSRVFAPVCCYNSFLNPDSTDAVARPCHSPTYPFDLSGLRLAPEGSRYLRGCKIATWDCRCQRSQISISDMDNDCAFASCDWPSFRFKARY
jgi:hypothetical protein